MVSISENMFDEIIAMFRHARKFISSREKNKLFLRCAVCGSPLRYDYDDYSDKIFVDSCKECKGSKLDCDEPFDWQQCPEHEFFTK